MTLNNSISLRRPFTPAWSRLDSHLRKDDNVGLRSVLLTGYKSLAALASSHPMQEHSHVRLMTQPTALPYIQRRQLDNLAEVIDFS